MNFLYPRDLIEPRLVDEMFRDEAAVLLARGHSVSLMDSNTFVIDARTFRVPSNMDLRVVYRGWMATPVEYDMLVQSIEQQGATPLTSREQYLSTHYLPNWYPLVADLTPETVVLDPFAEDLIPALTKLGWPRLFVKDYVKSLKTAGGSIIERPEDIGRVMAEMQKFRGTIEGGLCVRRFEEFVPDSEHRFFVIGGKCWAPDPQSTIPLSVKECARRLGSPFFSVDVAMRTDGVERLIEVGDGQVSDRVGWSADRFADLWDDMRLEA